MDHRYIVRQACKEDCKDIRRLIQELAEYERMSNGPEIDSQVLENDGFGARPFFEAFVAVDSEYSQLVGYVLYFYSYSTWQGKSLYMEDIYVQPEHRKKRIGLTMLRHVAQAALKENCRRLNFSVLNWNQPSIDFYKSLGAVDLTKEEGWHCFRLHQPQIEQLANC